VPATGGFKGWLWRRIKANKATWIWRGATLIVILLGVGVLIFINRDKTSFASVGSCVKASGATLLHAETSQVSCDDPLAVFLVTQHDGTDSSCDSHEVKFVERTTAGDTTAVLCLRYNLKPGECLDVGPVAGTVPKKVSCSTADPVNALKLNTLLTTTSDESACPAGSKSTGLVKRQLAYCFGPVS